MRERETVTDTDRDSDRHRQSQRDTERQRQNSSSKTPDGLGPATSCRVQPVPLCVTDKTQSTNSIDSHRTFKQNPTM